MAAVRGMLGPATGDTQGASFIRRCYYNRTIYTGVIEGFCSCETYIEQVNVKTRWLMNRNLAALVIYDEILSLQLGLDFVYDQNVPSCC